MGIVTIKKETGLPKYRQIVNSIEKAIADGKLKKGDKLPSLNRIKNTHQLSRDTVLTAFNDLKTRGIVESIVGKGYYVLSENIEINHKIFLLFDEFNSFKEDLYNSFIDALGINIQVDIFFHHFNYTVFNNLINDNLGDYSYYVIMPANIVKAEQVINKLPYNKVYILDQTNPRLNQYPAVYQNFEKDIYEGLQKVDPLLKKYNTIILLFTPNKQPQGILKGFNLFCKNYNYNYEVIESFDNRKILKGEVYVVLDDKNLIRIIKKIKDEQLHFAVDVGILSYNDTLLKEIVEGGITTISTNFKHMGNKLAHMILNGDKHQVENPNSVVIRNSL